MKKILFVLLMLAANIVVAQLPANFALLRSYSTNRDSVRQNVIARELLTDMVRVGLTDSILPTKTSTHQTRLFNWVLRTFAGLRWREIDGKKHSMVGTMQGGMSSPSKDFFTEYDVTFQTFQHTPKYMDLVKIAYQAQYEKMLKGRNYLKKRNLFPDTLTYASLPKLRIHPEHTPLKANRDSLNKYFLPCKPGTGIDNHPAWGVPNPTVGVYGAFVLDGNHKGGPEIHPYEWLWWLDTKEADPTKTVWYAGLLREGSNRFLRWSKKPRVGFVKLPFILDLTTGSNTIKIDQLLVGKMKPEALSKLDSYCPPGHNSFKNATVDIQRGAYQLHITSDKQVEGTRWWLSIEGEQGGLVWGYVNIAVATDDMYAIRMTVED